jgi:hypothetical protein
LDRCRASCTAVWNSEARSGVHGESDADDQTTELHAATDASLEQIRYFCRVIQHPQGGFDVDC